ncbi:hypothetical protein [Sulfodiicoccus acidiphilus]|nr:hypothetical protein [Sulfodiicoccus acidiphilus]
MRMEVEHRVEGLSKSDRAVLEELNFRKFKASLENLKRFVD